MSGYVFHCTPCGTPHAGECPPKEPNPTVSQLSPRAADGQKWRWADGVHTIVNVDHHRGQCTLLLHGDPSQELLEWGIYYGKPAGAVEFVE